MNEMNAEGEGECAPVCGGATLQRVWGAEGDEMCRSNPSRSWPVQAGESGDRAPGACLQKCSQHVHLCWAIASLPGFAGLCVFPLVSLGETVSLRDKIRQSYEGGRHLNHQNR